MPNNSDSPRFAAFSGLIRSISSDHHKLIIDEESMREKLLLCVECDEVDYPKIVGAQGQNVRAIEVLYALASWRDEGKDGVVRASTPDTAKRATKAAFKLNPKWGEKDLLAILKPLLAVCFDRGAVDIKEVNHETMVVRISISGHDGTTHLSEIGRCPPLAFSVVEESMTRILRALVKANGRDIEVEMTQL